MVGESCPGERADPDRVRTIGASTGEAGAAETRTRRPGVGQVLRVAFVVAAVALAFVALRHDGQRALTDAGRVGPLRLAAAFALGAAGLYASGLAWRDVVLGLGGRVTVCAGFDVFFVGQLGKYIPGSVFAVLGQVQRASAVGVGRTQVGAAALVVMVLNIVSGSLVAVGLLPLAGVGIVGAHPEIVAALPVGLIVLHPRVFGWLLDLALRVTRRPPLATRLSFAALRSSSGWSLVMWLCYGLHTWLLAGGLGAHGARLVLLAIGGYALSWVVGFLVILVPAGLGVRDAALALALRSVLPAPAAIAVSILSRLLMTASDLAVAGASLLLHRRVRGRRHELAPRATSSERVH